MVTFLAPSLGFPQHSIIWEERIHSIRHPVMSLLEPSVEDVVLSVEQMRWVSLSALVVLIWDHSKCPGFS